ncbi:polymer-forming cytoskeletal protein [Treponema sp.]|uniref:bactofilin family protein n=1 Tax=Treponema sp. TaxID=166 RepID=UPI00298E1158|nr:polymer-forming cytoskeletal protein [Treponema sp.]MCR5612387.1 polymer-forming cytoskeletal protein [Treponema sp.]
MEGEKRNFTVLGSETEFDGVLEFTDDLKINGRFSGTIIAEGNLEIDKGATCNVDKMSANSIIISGTVTGDIEAVERVEMCSGSKVKGNVTTARLRIADNVDFEGQVTMLDKEPDVDLFSVASEEFKQSLILKSDTEN